MVYVNITEFIAELKINWINTLYVFGKKNYTCIIGQRLSPNCLYASIYYKIFSASKYKLGSKRYVFVGNYKRSYTIRQFFFSSSN